MTPVTNSEITAYPPQISVYDGSCGFCSRSVRFILRHERRHDLSFVTRNSELGMGLRRAHGLESVESMLTLLWAFLRCPQGETSAPLLFLCWKEP